MAALRFETPAAILVLHFSSFTLLFKKTKKFQPFSSSVVCIGDFYGDVFEWKLELPARLASSARLHREGCGQSQFLTLRKERRLLV